MNEGGTGRPIVSNSHNLLLVNGSPPIKQPSLGVDSCEVHIDTPQWSSPKAQGSFHPKIKAFHDSP
jgi:hypothetical protein